MYVSRQKPRLEAAKVLPRTRNFKNLKALVQTIWLGFRLNIWGHKKADFAPTPWNFGELFSNQLKLGEPRLHAKFEKLEHKASGLDSRLRFAWTDDRQTTADRRQTIHCQGQGTPITKCRLKLLFQMWMQITKYMQIYANLLKTMLIYA